MRVNGLHSMKHNQFTDIDEIPPNHDINAKTMTGLMKKKSLRVCWFKFGKCLTVPLCIYRMYSVPMTTFGRRRSKNVVQLMHCKPLHNLQCTHIKYTYSISIPVLILAFVRTNCTKNICILLPFISLTVFPIHLSCRIYWETERKCGLFFLKML